MNKARKKRAPVPVYIRPNQLTLDCFKTPFDQHLNKAVYQQQKQMCDIKSHSVEDRIVSINKPYVRPTNCEWKDNGFCSLELLAHKIYCTPYTKIFSLTTEITI